MGIFRRTPSATLVGTELTTAVEAIEHSIRVLSSQDTVTPADRSAIERRGRLAQRLRRAI